MLRRSCGPLSRAPRPDRGRVRRPAPLDRQWRLFVAVAQELKQRRLPRPDGPRGTRTPPLGVMVRFALTPRGDVPSPFCRSFADVLGIESGGGTELAANATLAAAPPLPVTTSMIGRGSARRDCLPTFARSRPRGCAPRPLTELVLARERCTCRNPGCEGPTSLALVGPHPRQSASKLSLAGAPPPGRRRSGGDGGRRGFLAKWPLACFWFLRLPEPFRSVWPTRNPTNRSQGA